MNTINKDNYILDFNKEELFNMFGTTLEMKVYREIFKQSENLIWVHDTTSRLRTCELLNISEIGFKVILRTLKTRTLLIKQEKAVYKINSDFLVNDIFEAKKELNKYKSGIRL